MNKKSKLFLMLLLSTISFGAADDGTIGELSARIDVLEKSINGQLPSGEDLNEELESLRNQLKSLNGRCEELEHQLTELRQHTTGGGSKPINRQQAEGQAFEETAEEDEEISGLPDDEAVLKILASKGEEEGKTGKKGAVEKLRDIRTKEAQQASSSSLNVAKDMPKYDEAMGLYKKSDYKKAGATFASFIKANPGDKKVPDALYWQGECLLKAGQYKDAQTAFVNAYKKKTSKSQEALFGLGKALAQDKQKDKAKTIWTKLKEDNKLSAELRKKVTEALKTL